MKRSLQNLLWIAPLILLVVTDARPDYAFAHEHIDDLVDVPCVSNAERSEGEAP